MYGQFGTLQISPMIFFFTAALNEDVDLSIYKPMKYWCTNCMYMYIYIIGGSIPFTLPEAPIFKVVIDGTNFFLDMQFVCVCVCGGGGGVLLYEQKTIVSVQLGKACTNVFYHGKRTTNR